MAPDDREGKRVKGGLPFLYQVVEIDGEAYWDGGDMGNPVLYPLVSECSLALLRTGPRAATSSGVSGRSSAP